MADLTPWEAYKVITVQDPFVDGPLTDFPLHYPIEADADIGGRSEADGRDIRFTLSDGTTLLSFEIDNFSIVAGEGFANIWIKVPSIAASGGASIRVYYGNGAVGDGQDVDNTWRSEYKFVGHMSDATTSTVSDSSGNGRTGNKGAANNPAETAVSQINLAQDFDGDDLIDVSFSSSHADGPSGKSAYTIEGWAKHDAAANNDGIMGWFLANPGCFLQTSGGGWLFFVGTASDDFGTKSGIDDTNWHHVAGVFDGGGATDDDKLKIYFDGVDQGPLSFASSIPTAIGAFTTDLQLGKPANVSRFWTGELDEMRIYDGALSAAWLRFQYANIKEVDHELEIGAEVVQAVGVAPGFVETQWAGQVTDLLFVR